MSSDNPLPAVIGIGECMVEFYVDPRDQPAELAEGGLAGAVLLRKTFGGDVLNTLVMLARLGTPAGFLTKIGDDPFGPFLRQSWLREGIDLAHAPTVPGYNGIYFIATRAGGERDFTYYRSGSAPSTLSPADITPEGAGYLNSAKMLYASAISQAISPTARAAVLRAAQVAHEHGTGLAYDTNLRLRLWSLPEARTALEEVLPYMQLALPSAGDETRHLLGTDDPEAVLHWFLERGVPMVAVKCSIEGCLVGERESGQIHHVPAYIAGEAVDTTAAGDSFNAGLLHGLMSGQSLVEAARIGVVVAGLKVLRRGAVSGLCSQAEAQEALPNAPEPRLHKTITLTSTDIPAPPATHSIDSPGELLDIYDVRGTPLGKMERARVHTEGHWHHTFHCWIAGPDYLLLQRRSRHKQHWAGLLDVSSAGHYGAGEPDEAGLRELAEELGLAADWEQMIPLGIRTAIEEYGDGSRDNEWQHVYLLLHDQPLSAYAPDRQELEGLVKLPVEAGIDLLTGKIDAVEVDALVWASPDAPAHEERITITRDDFATTPDRYFYKMLLLTRLALKGERELAV